MVREIKEPLYTWDIMVVLGEDWGMGDMGFFEVALWGAGGA